LAYLAVGPRRASPGRAAGGSVIPRKMAWRPAAENDTTVQGHRLALEGQRLGCPFQ
jgi:hypothetical protein